MISTQVAILIEEVLKTMFLPKLKLAIAAVLFLGAAGAAGVLAQQCAGSARKPAMDQTEMPAAESRQVPEVDSSSAPVPAYITQSRALILTRLQEEAAEARARLDRINRTGRSPHDPAVVHARKTFEDLQQRLDRIDQVLADVVEKYPTMVDFSEGPGMIAFTSQPGDNSKRQPRETDIRWDVRSPAPVELLGERSCPMGETNVREGISLKGAA